MRSHLGPCCQRQEEPLKVLEQEGGLWPVCLVRQSLCCAERGAGSKEAAVMGPARQAPPSMAFSRRKYCGGLPFPSPGDLPDPGIEPGSPCS